VSVRYLLDTNVVSEPLRPRPSGALVRRLASRQTECALPSPVWHEMWYGCRRLPESRRRAAIERYLADVVLESFPILDYDAVAAEWHARERARMEAGGKSAPFVDGQIAAIAAVHGLVLVTANRADFRFFRGLKVENWT
jgi:tRNA(fMet)-specific endonuclease VapC